MTQCLPGVGQPQSSRAQGAGMFVGSCLCPTVGKHPWAEVELTPQQEASSWTLTSWFCFCLSGHVSKAPALEGAGSLALCPGECHGHRCASQGAARGGRGWLEPPSLRRARPAAAAGPERPQPPETLRALRGTLGQDQPHLQVRQAWTGSQAGLLLPKGSVCSCDVALRAAGELCAEPQQACPQHLHIPHELTTNTAALPALPSQPCSAPWQHPWAHTVTAELSLHPQHSPAAPLPPQPPCEGSPHSLFLKDLFIQLLLMVP